MKGIDNRATELHLHPKMQGNLIDLFVKCINLKSTNINIIIETHSETIVNRIGYLIYSNKISKDNINVYLLKKKTNGVIVDQGYYDENGILENWPIDFFNAEEI